MFNNKVNKGIAGIWCRYGSTTLNQGLFDSLSLKITIWNSVHSLSQDAGLVAYLAIKAQYSQLT